MVRIRAALARVRESIASPSDRGPTFWLVTLLLGLLLPVPVAVVVVAARLRHTGLGRPPRPTGA
jgi:hypothetical protein